MSDENDESERPASERPPASKQAAEPTLKAHAESHDATGADPKEAKAKDELFEAIDHLKSAAGILFSRARHSKELENASKQAEKVAKNIGDAAEPLSREAGRVAREIGDAAEPLAKQLTGELGRLTRDVMSVVEGGARGLSKKRAKRPRGGDDEEE